MKITCPLQLVNRQDKFQGQALSSMSCLYGHTLQKQNKTGKKKLGTKGKRCLQNTKSPLILTECDSGEQQERGF